jgi:SAM-dependent methyltransferase
MNTYEFVSDWVRRRVTGQAACVLDYGCGAGQIVKLLRRAQVDAWGCDVFYEGGDSSRLIPEELRPFIRRMSNNVIPYEDSKFDVVVSNQVFEHVPDMAAALREIARVLKPGGTALNVFPDRGVWREGHCGIPFLHWFPKGTQPRVYYAALMRLLGFGNFTAGKSSMQWSHDFCKWLDDWTYYRSAAEIHAQFEDLLGNTTGVEEEWLRARYNGRFESLPVGLQRFIVRKLGGRTLVSTRGVH